MSGSLFTPPPYRAHVAHIIKQSDETRTGSPIPITDDAELFAVLRPSTIYQVRIMLVASHGGGAPTSLVWLPACTSSVDFASLIYHRGVADNGTEQWSTGSNGDHRGHLMDTAIFNAGTPSFHFAQAGGHSCYGMIQTGSGGGTFSIKWGGTNGTVIMFAGSLMYLQEALAP